MSAKTIDILEQLKSLSLLETSELVKQIEATFGVDASVRPFTIPRPPLPPLITWIESTFDVVLEEVPADRKIGILKVVRVITSLGLKEAKDFVESVPQVVKFAIAPSDAEDLKQQLESVGAKVSLRNSEL